MFAKPAACLVVLCVVLTTACGLGGKWEVRTYNMGERIDLGHLIYNVFDTQWKMGLGDGASMRVPKSRYLLVRVMISNSGNKDLLVPSINLIDDRGNTYDEVTNGESVPQWLGFVRQVGPVDSINGNIVYDVPAAHYKLRITDESEERAALVDLPLTFSSETDSMPHK